MKWFASMIRCLCCTYEYASVYPEVCNEDRLECPSCGAQDSEIVERINPK